MDAAPAAQRLAGDGRVTTAIALADAAWGSTGADLIMLASARDFPDALAAAPWAAAHDAPLLLTEPTSLPPEVGDALDRLGATEVVIVGGDDAVGSSVERDLTSRDLAVRRLAGDDRFATARAVATDLHEQAPTAIVVAAASFADAVAGGPLVIRGDHPPVLLTRHDEVPDPTAAALRRLGTESVTIVGGPAVVSDGVVRQLEAAGLETQRIAGDDRYATSAAVVAEAAVRHGGGDALTAVTGVDFPDALAANPYAGRRGATVLLVDQDDLIDHPATGEALAASGASWHCTTVVGGPGAVAVRVAEQITAATGAEPPDGDPVLLAAGDIASCGLRADEATGALLDTLAGTVLTLGDNAYNDGTPAQYRDCYRPAWGSHLVRTRAALGNHDIRTAAGGPTYDFFGIRAGPRDRGWHAFDLGPHWRAVVLHTNCPGTVRCDAESEQLAWLRDQLAAAGDRHVIVASHHPRWSSGVYAPGEARVSELWETAVANGADVWLAGHEHGYERFAPLGPDGSPDPEGTRQITAGTGGASLRPFGEPRAGSQARVVAHGVLELTLRPDGYAWRFLDIDGATRDEGDHTLPS